MDWGLCSPGNPLLAFAAIVIVINIDEKHKSMTASSGHNFISGYKRYKI